MGTTPILPVGLYGTPEIGLWLPSAFAPDVAEAITIDEVGGGDSGVATLHCGMLTRSWRNLIMRSLTYGFAFVQRGTAMNVNQQERRRVTSNVLMNWIFQQYRLPHAFCYEVGDGFVGNAVVHGKMNMEACNEIVALSKLAGSPTSVEYGDGDLGGSPAFRTLTVFNQVNMQLFDTDLFRNRMCEHLNTLRDTNLLNRLLDAVHNSGQIQIKCYVKKGVRKND